MTTAIEFRAPWSGRLRIVTVLGVSMLVAIAIAGISFRRGQPVAVLLLFGLLPLIIVAASAAFTVRGYVLTEEAILVKRAGWITRLPLAGLESVSGDAEAMDRSIRLFGNGGLFSFSGEFWSRKLRRYRALATDPSRAVILRWPKRTVVITPHDPQHFIMRARTLIRHADFGRTPRP